MKTIDRMLTTAVAAAVGLIGATSPAEIAVSILAQMTEALRRGEKTEAA